MAHGRRAHLFRAVVRRRAESHPVRQREYGTYWHVADGYGSASYGLQRAENSKSFDVGIEKSFLNTGLDIDVSYFNVKYHDVLEGWEQNTGGGGSWTTQNDPGKVKTEGFELVSKWKTNDRLNFGFNYTYTSSYDGAEADNPDRNESYTNNQLVRVPRHILNLQTKIKVPNFENLDFTINTK